MKKKWMFSLQILSHTLESNDLSNILPDLACDYFLKSFSKNAPSKLLSGKETITSTKKSLDKQRNAKII